MINTKPNNGLKFLFCLIILVCFYGCQKNEPLTFKKRTIAIDDFYDCLAVDCAITEIFLVECLGESEISNSVNKEIEKAACAALHLDEDSSLNTIEEALKSFNTSYQEMKKEFPEETIPYEASINSDISFRNTNLLSILVDSYIFTGGAHGSGNSNFVNIDLESGKIVDNKKLLKDYRDFSNFVEKIFRKTHSIPENQSINSSGFFFENDIFSLPINIGLTDTHIILLYNQYEISSYAEGPIELKLDKQEVKDYFAVNILQ
ncbi:DUF3298 and DUF4163 domain-containing protein [Aquimarina rubra]|uniref:DUF3298 and DUF4163 domain-containing protein n=1 Tax=Aquimarina rubra TaxID=1920033 RepID=A0ABW5LFV8_9FLAO